MHTSATSTKTLSRIAGITFLVYIVAGLASMALGDRSPMSDLLLLLQSFSALGLGVTLYILTRAYGPGLALFALTCRVAEAIQYGDSALYFAVGSLCFAWLLLQGRLVPTVLAQLGVLASALLVVVLPAQTAGLFGGAISWAASSVWLTWLPMLVFEVALALWLIVRGVALRASSLEAPASTF